MKIADINPFLRYVNMGNHRAINDWVRTYDQRLFYILGGECALWIEDERFLLAAHTLVLLRAGIPYRFENAKNMQMVVFNFDYTRKNSKQKEVMRPLLLHDFEENNIFEKESFEDFPTFDQPIVLPDMQTFERALEEIVEIYKTPKLFHEELASAKLKVLLCRLAERIAYAFTDVHSLVDKALEYIKTHYQEEITNADVGKHLGYHPYYINRLMLRQTGLPLRQHLIKCRLDAAKEMLVSSELSISQIAELCGFSCIAVFSSAFKERVGETPTAFRKRFANRL